jgi:NAD-dependent deacetylase
LPPRPWTTAPVTFHFLPPLQMSDSRLTHHLRTARRIFIFTGAGISTASGIPDFRGPGGVWTRRAPVYYDDFMSSESARIEHWDYKLEAWPALRAAKPNQVHQAIVALEQAGKVRAVVTQNIDGLHALAGSKDTIELHGTNALVECQTCSWRGDPEPHYQFFRIHRKPPLCQCGGFLKAATISFGQNLNPADIERATDAARGCDLVVALGSTLSVYPAASFPLLAAQRGVPYAIINRGPTDHDHEPAVTLRLDGDVIEIFPPSVEAALAAH